MEVLKAAALELRELRNRQIQLTRRIRTLRSTMVALRNLQHQHSSYSQSDSARVKRPISHEPDEELRRACRIALLESLDGLTGDEVFARIVRRGSYRFVDIASAKPAIKAELNAMAEEGELEREIGEFGPKWKRVANSSGR